MAVTTTLLSDPGREASPMDNGEPGWGHLHLADPRDLPPRDRRLGVRGVNSPVAPKQFDSRAKWEARAPRLREQILSASGLWPLPERTPLNAQIFDRLEQEGYSVEKVYFESSPHFFCTGNLYRPLGGSAKPPFPGILCPHGHWRYGRLENATGDDNGVSVPQRCMNFALQGYVSFSYDMVGRNDSFQLPHYWGTDRHAPWGLIPEAHRLHLWGVSVCRLQLWNSIRALDFLLSLPEIDPERIGITGASGGANQTLMVTAVDDRLRAIAPVNMISHFHQGGCVCENAPNLRIDTDNIEIAALAAPRSLLMVSATGDWTCDTPRIEYPAVRAVYQLLEVPDQVSQEQFPYRHNYNRFSREAVYRFFARSLARNPAKTNVQQVEEKGEVYIDPGQLLVFSRRLPPSDAVDFPQLAEYLTGDARRQLHSAYPKNRQDLESYRRLFAPVYRTAVMVEAPSPDDLRQWPLPSQHNDGKRKPATENLILSRISAGDRIPARIVRSSNPVRLAALIIHAQGSEAALGSFESPVPLAKELHQRGCMLLSVDAFQTGVARDSARKEEETYFSTYNRTETVQRVQDILTALVYLKAAWRPERIVVAGQGAAGLWCLLARPFFPEPYAVAADVDGFDSASDQAYLEKLQVPLLRRAGDFQTAALLGPDAPLLLHNVGQAFSTEPFSHASNLYGTTQHLRLSKSELPAPDVATWLLSS